MYLTTAAVIQIHANYLMHQGRLEGHIKNYMVGIPLSLCLESGECGWYQFSTFSGDCDPERSGLLGRYSLVCPGALIRTSNAS